MGVTLIHLPHPVTTEGLAVSEHRPGVSLEALARPEWGDCFAIVDGRPLPADEWGAPLADGSIVAVRAAMLGDDTDPLRTILQIALIVGIAYFGVWAVGAELTALKVAVGTAAIAVGGTLVINAIAPPRLPGLDAQADGPPPIHSLTGGANRARPFEPLPLLLGRHRVFPDLAARPYSQFVSAPAAGDAAVEWWRGSAVVPGVNLPAIRPPTAAAPAGSSDQFLFQIFNFGLGAHDIDAATLKLGETPLSALEEVTTQWSDAATGAITLVAGNVDAEEGGALDDADWVRKSTSPKTSRAELDFQASIFKISRRGQVQSHFVDLRVEWWPGDQPAETRTADQIAKTRAMKLTLRHAETSAHRVTVPLEGLDPAGVWQVRVKRVLAPSDSDRTHDDVHWTALRSFQPDEADYRGQTRLAVKVRASGQLSGRLDRLSAIDATKWPVWEIPDGGTEPAWSEPKATSNPAWLFLGFARGVYVDRDATRELLAGVGLADGRIDVEGLKRWGAWCDANGLECNYQLTRALTLQQTLELIAQCGRASPSWATGKLGVVWDAEGVPATHFFSPGNIVAGSLEVDWVSQGAADEIVCSYVEPDADWQRVDVRRSVPGAAAPSRTAALTLHGVTKREQAAKACNLQAARQIHHRRRIRWRTGPEGLSCERGQVAHLTHSLVTGGVAGRLLRVGGEGVSDRCLVRDVDYRQGAAGRRFQRIADFDAPLPAAWLAAGADRTVAQIRLYETGQMRLLLKDRAGELTPAIEAGLRITVRRAGRVLRAPGPDAAANQVRDASGRWYVWTPAAGVAAEVAAMYRAIEIDDELDVSIDDGSDVKLDRDVRIPAVADPPGPAEPHVMLRLPDGSMHVSAVRAGPSADQPVLLTALPAIEGDHLDCLWRYYAADAPPLKVKIVAVRPAADGTVELEAIDEVAEYYAAATSDLTVPLPPIHRGRPKVAAIEITERLVEAGAGYAVECTANLAVEGDWRGGEVRWCLGAGADRQAERLAERLAGNDLDATFLTPPTGTITVRAIPGSAAAPAGDSKTVEHVIVGVEALPAAPAGLAVTAVSGGWLATWDRPDEVDYAHSEVFEAAYPADAAAAPALPAKALGTADSSQWSRRDAPASRVRVWVRHVDRSGHVGEAAHRDVTPDAAGGIVWTGDWEGNTPYDVDDAVSSDGRSWICVAKHTSRGDEDATPPVPDDPPTGGDGGNGGSVGSAASAEKVDRWNLLAEAGDDGVDGLGVDWRGGWTDSPEDPDTYELNDAVSSDDRSWICKLAHTPKAGAHPTEANGGTVAGKAGTANAAVNDKWDLLADRGGQGLPGVSVGVVDVVFTGGRPAWSPAAAQWATAKWVRGGATLFEARIAWNVDSDGDITYDDSSSASRQYRAAPADDEAAWVNWPAGNDDPAGVTRETLERFTSGASQTRCWIVAYQGVEACLLGRSVRDGLSRSDARITVGGESGPSGAAAGDIWIAADGYVYTYSAGAWVKSNVDLTGADGATIHTGVVAAGALPAKSAGVNPGDVFVATDGRWWTRTAAGAWGDPKGDLTGPKGDKGDPGDEGPAGISVSGRPQPRWNSREGSRTWDTAERQSPSP